MPWGYGIGGVVALGIMIVGIAATGAAATRVPLGKMAPDAMMDVSIEVVVEFVARMAHSKVTNGTGNLSHWAIVFSALVLLAFGVTACAGIEKATIHARGDLFRQAAREVVDAFYFQLERLINDV